MYSLDANHVLRIFGILEVLPFPFLKLSLLKIWWVLGEKQTEIFLFKQFLVKIVKNTLSYNLSFLAKTEFLKILGI